MIEVISFRCEENNTIMSLNEEVDFQVLMDAVSERLRLCKENKVKSPYKIKVDLGHRKITPSELLELFDVILHEKIVFIEGITSSINEVKDAEVYEGTIRGGQIKYFDNSIMIKGDINPNATIYCNDNLYCIGTIRGKVIAKKKSCQIVASNYSNCLIQIFDSKPLFIEKLESTYLTYDAGEVKVNETMKGVINKNG